MTTKLSESEADAEEPANRMARSRTFSLLYSSLATATMQFSLDRKQRSHKQNQCSASDSVGLNFTRSYRSTLLIVTSTMSQSLGKTSLDYAYDSVAYDQVKTALSESQAEAEE